MVTTRSQDRKISSSSSPLPSEETGAALAPKEATLPSTKSQNPSVRTPASDKNAPSSPTKKIEVVIDVAPHRDAAASLPSREESQSDAKEVGQLISQNQPALFGFSHESDRGRPEDPAPNNEADTAQLEDRGGLESKSQDSREVQATLADRSKRPVSPAYTPASVPKRKRFSSEDLEDTIPRAETSTTQLADTVIVNAADKDGVEVYDDDDEDDDAPEVVSSSTAAQQVLGMPNPSLQHTGRKRRKMMKNVADDEDSTIAMPDSVVNQEAQKLETARDKAEDRTTSGQVPIQGVSESETDQAPKPPTDDTTADKTVLLETIEIITAPRTNETSAPANSTRPPAKIELTSQAPENVDTSAKLQASQPQLLEEISPSTEPAQKANSKEQDQHAVNLSTSLSQEPSVGSGDFPVTSSDAPSAPLQAVTETEVIAEAIAIIPAPESQAQGTPEVLANTASKFLGSGTTDPADASTRNAMVKGVSVKSSIPRTHASRVRPHSRTSLHERDALSRPTPTSLQQYRTRLLNRHPRTANWGPPGFRKAKFVGA